MTSPDRPDTAWRDQAACIGADPRVFTDPRPDSDDTRQAIRICNSCPVKQPCLDIALAHHPDADIGIWGGTTPEARKALRQPTTPEPPTIGLHHTLDGDLTDLSGRARIVHLPAAPALLVLVDRQPTLRTDQLDHIRQYLTTTLEDYQPERLAPLSINTDGDVTDPSGRIAITRLPTPPHLLLIDNGSPWARAQSLAQARHQALSLLEHSQAAISSFPPSADRAALRRPPSPARSLPRQ